MKVEYINPFIEAAQSVIKMLCHTNVNIGKVYLRNSPSTYNQIIIVIGVVGKIKGQICFEMSYEVAQKIASAMMGGIPITELDEISKSAISEMGNMIMGNASILFANNSIDIDITPPTLFAGDNIHISNKVSAIVIPLILEGIGTLNININAD